MLAISVIALVAVFAPMRLGVVHWCRLVLRRHLFLRCLLIAFVLGIYILLTLFFLALGLLLRLRG